MWSNNTGDANIEVGSEGCVDKTTHYRTVVEFMGSYLLQVTLG